MANDHTGVRAHCYNRSISRVHSGDRRPALQVLATVTSPVPGLTVTRDDAIELLSRAQAALTASEITDTEILEAMASNPGLTHTQAQQLFGVLCTLGTPASDPTRPIGLAQEFVYRFLERCIETHPELHTPQNMRAIISNAKAWETLPFGLVSFLLAYAVPLGVVSGPLQVRLMKEAPAWMTERLKDLGHSPYATLTLYRAWAERAPRDILASPRAMADARTRAILIARARHLVSWKSLADLVSAFPVEAMHEPLAALIERTPEKAIETLRALSPERLAGVPQDIWIALSQIPDSEVRLQAMLLAGMCPDPDDETPAPPSPPSPLRTLL